MFVVIIGLCMKCIVVGVVVVCLSMSWWLDCIWFVSYCVVFLVVLLFVGMLIIVLLCSLKLLIL